MCFPGRRVTVRPHVKFHFDGPYRAGTCRLPVLLMANWMQMNEEFGDLVVRARQKTVEVER